MVNDANINSSARETVLNEQEKGVIYSLGEKAVDTAQEAGNDIYKTGEKFGNFMNSLSDKNKKDED